MILKLGMKQQGMQLYKVYVNHDPGIRGGHSLVSSVPMRDQRIVEHTLNSVIDI